jgi:hypothetical protein
MNNKMPKASVQISVNAVTRNPFNDRSDNFSPPKRSHVYSGKHKANGKFKSLPEKTLETPKAYKGSKMSKKPLFSRNSPGARARIGRRRPGLGTSIIEGSRELPHLRGTKKSHKNLASPIMRGGMDRNAIRRNNFMVRSMDVRNIRSKKRKGPLNNSYNNMEEAGRAGSRIRQRSKDGKMTRVKKLKNEFKK